MDLFSAPAWRGGPAAPLETARRGPRLIFVLLAAFTVESTLVDEESGQAFNVAVLEDGYCSSPLRQGEEDDMQDGLNTNTIPCNKLMEFIYISRLKVHEHLAGLRTESDPKIDSVPTPWEASMRRVSRASALISAHVHIIGSLIAQRPECFSEHMRLSLIVSLRRLKMLTTSQIKQVWLMGQEGPHLATEMAQKAHEWLAEASDIIHADLTTMRTVLREWEEPSLDESRYYSHEADGRYSTMEALRRDTFEEEQADKGLLRGLVRHVLPLDAAVADFGAGSGHYAKWLNDTGLVTAFAFDGSPDIELVTKGVVHGADLGTPVTLWRTFDWVICIDVGEHISPESTQVFLRNLDMHALNGLVISWSPGLPGVESANPLAGTQVAELLLEHTGLSFDLDLTNKLRASASSSALAESLFVLVRRPRQNREDSVAPGCAAEEGWIYTGSDIQMFGNVASAAECCQICNTHDDCRFWTWSRDESIKDACWIKAAREYRINKEGFVSGSRNVAPR